MRTEDQVRNEAERILGFDDQAILKQGTGQITTFNQLGYTNHKLKNHKPDGWYLPEDKHVAIILETKSEKEPVEHEPWVDELLKNCSVLTDYKNVIGILYNGNRTNVFLNGDPVEIASNRPLQHKDYYINLVTDKALDKNHIYQVTQRINNSLHFKFGMTDLQDRMIFTACALVVHSRDHEVLTRVKNLGYNTFHDHISNKLAEAIKEDTSKRRNDKLNILVEEYAAVRMSITEDQNAINSFIDDVSEIGDMINSHHWNGEDVMGIFFNEFSRYKKKSDAGQVFTPDHITSLMYRLINVDQDDKVLDATCGSGAFLVKAMSNMIKEAGGVSTSKAKQIKSEQLFGIELYRKVYALACANMLIHKDGKTNLEQLDARSEEAGKWISSQNITKVLMNPPFERKYGCMDIVENVLDNVPPHTPCAFIMPDKKLEKTGKKQKERILKKHRLKKVIKLPEDLFFGIGITASIFVFEAGVPQDDKEFFACYMKSDGLATVKNKGRHDVYGKWAAIEKHWVEVIERQSDEDTCQWMDPAKHLSYQMPQKPFEIFEEDFRKTAMDYLMFQQDIDSKALGEKLRLR